MRKQNPPTGPGGSGRDDAPVVERDERDRAARQARVTDGPGPGSDGIPPAPTEPPAVPGLPHQQHDDAEPYGTKVHPIPSAVKNAPAAASGAGTRSSSSRTSPARKSSRRTSAAPEPLLDRDTGEELNARFRDTLATFVDSPSDAVSDADDVVAQITKLVTDAIQARRGALEQAKREAGGDTEQLRLALQKYRAFVQGMLKL
ncbi:hypothetical protein [Embleya sp. NBC_00896]|uniref:hypothetical protein n=1 Tax=Embleya sp. NBC_00896 TaxID=2975961 RepID=UPI00386F7427|nr:hypothetical protein OG928_14800 [Embleya sp. NBC_00896]